MTILPPLIASLQPVSVPDESDSPINIDRARARRTARRQRPDLASTSGLGGDTILGLIGTAAGMLVGLLAFRSLAKAVGPEVYGTVAAAYGIVGLAISLSSASVTLGALQNLTKPRSSPDAPGSFVTLGFVSCALATTLACIVGPLVVPQLSRGLLATFFLVEIMGSGVMQIVLGVVGAIAGFRPTAWARIFHSAARCVLLLGLLAVSTVTLERYVIVQALGVSAALFGALALARRRHIPVGPGGIRKQHVVDSGRFAVGLTALSVQTDFDKTVLVNTNQLTDAGMYAAAYRLINMVDMALGQIVAASHNRLMGVGHRDPQLLKRRVIQICGVIVAANAAAGLVGFFSQRPIRILIGSEFTGTHRIMMLLMPLVGMRAIGSVLSNALIALGWLKIRLVAVISSSVVGIIAYLVLIPRYGWQGAFVGTIISETLLVTIVGGGFVQASRQTNTTPTPGAGTALRVAVVGPPTSRGFLTNELVPGASLANDEAVETTLAQLGEGIEITFISAAPNGDAVVQLDAVAPDRIVLLGIRPHILDWAARRKTPTLVLASEVDLGDSQSSVWQRTRRLLNDEAVDAIACQGWNTPSRLIAAGVTPAKVVAWGFRDRRDPLHTPIRSLPTFSVEPALVVLAAALDDHSGVSDALVAISLLRSQGISLRLQVFGDGPRMGHYVRYCQSTSINDCVEFVGTVDAAEFDERLKSASVALLAQRDGAPFALPALLTEATVRRIPIVCSDHEMFRINLIDGVSCVTFRAGDAESLAAGLRAALVDPDLYRRLSTNANGIWRNLRVDETWQRVVTSWLLSDNRHEWLDRVVSRQRAKLSSRR